MSASSSSLLRESLTRLRRLGFSAEMCNFCSAELALGHQHLLEMSNRGLECVCDACAILFTGQSQKYRRIPRGIRFLHDFRLTDEQWDSLAIPIGIAFLFYSSRAERVTALYPSPGGPVESMLALDSWREIAKDNPVVADMGADVEGLLVYRVGSARDHFLIPIDECFKLVGIIRTRWKGLSGGTQLWKEVEGFLAQLKQRGSDALSRTA